MYNGFLYIHFFLNKIATPYLVKFFISRFADTGKSITPEAAALIVTLTDNHPYYGQQLAQLSWLRTNKECTETIVREAHISLVEQLNLLFVTLTERLTNQQLAYMNAILANEKNITSTEVMHRYGISSSTSATRSKQTLIKNDIIDVSGAVISFQDPIYAWWLRHSYFNL